MRACIRQARYQRYYDRGSQSNWEAMKAADRQEGEAIAEFFGYALLVIAGILIALIGSQLGAFHMIVMVILTSPLWGGAWLLLTVCQPGDATKHARQAIKAAVEVNRRQRCK